MAMLKAKVMSALKNADGTPIKELDELMKTYPSVKQLFSENVTIRNSAQLVEQIEYKFDLIFKITE